MGFSFNWAGLTIPQVNLTEPAVKSEDFAALGKAARGYKNREAAKEYARKIDNYRRGIFADQQGNKARIAEIEAEIARLEQENAQLSAVPEPSQQELLFDPIPLTAEEEFALNFDPATASPEDIIKMQTTLKNAGYDLGNFGPNHDGIDGDWGGLSKTAFADKYGYLF